jgi:hypothetical protein
VRFGPKPLRAAFAVACLGVGAIAIACGPGFLDGISGGARATEPDAEAGTPGDARACQPRRLPDRPPGQDDNTGLALPTFAFESIRVVRCGAPDAGGAIPVGLDLDDRCTCPETDSCLRPGDAGASCDGKQGEDNALSGFFNSINIGVPLFQQTFATDRIQAGFFTLILDVLGWNGQPDDPNVVVTLRLSLRIEGKKEDGGLPPPKFDGTDVWTVDPTALAGGVDSVGKDCRVPADSYRCLSRVRDDRAYVRGGKLVAHPRFDGQSDSPVTVTILAGLGVINFDMYDFTLFGTFTRGEDGGVARLAGEITGRVTTENVLHTVGAIQDFTSDNDTPICKNAALYAVAKSSVCHTPDLAPPGKDNTGAKCDHISVAMSFSSSPATVGTVLLRQAPPEACDQSIFSCP